MMNNLIVYFARTTFMQHKAWMTATRTRLFHHHSNLALLSLKNLTVIPSASLSTTSKNEFKTPYNKKFLAFHQSLDSGKSDFTMTLSEWEKLEQDILEESPNFISHLDYSVMKSLNSKPELCLSFYHYIKSKREPNIPTVVEFIINVAGNYDDLVLAEVEKLMKNCDSAVFRMISWKVAFGVAKTKHWRQAVNYMYLGFESYLSVEIPAFAMRTVALVFQKSLEHQDYKTFHYVSGKFFSLLQQPCDRELISHTLFQCWRDSFIPTDLFMELLKLGQLPLEEDEINILETHCNNEWEHCESAKQMKVHSKSCICDSCGETVPEVKPLDELILRKLMDETLQKMLKGVHTKKAKSTELNNLIKLIKTQKKQFDYVIDAPNVGNFYLKSILKNLTRQRKHVLLIISTDIKSGFNLNSLRKEATVLLLQKGTFDDVYIMLAALMSGPNCYMVTNDDFRDHIAKVDIEVRSYFHAWRDRQRVFHNYDKLLHPPLFKWTVHESDSGWHIPGKKAIKVTEKDTDIPNALLLELHARIFLCVRKSNYVPSPELVAFREAAKSQTVIS